MIINKTNYRINYNKSRLINVKFSGLKPIIKCFENNALSDEQRALLNSLKTQYDFSKLKPIQWKIKRLIDYTGASALLVITSPIILIAGGLTKLESEGPIIFKQKRVGYLGKEFTLYKLRTMQDHASGEIVRRDIQDSRITKVGKILRKFSIDEFPQFLNVLKGDMSLVGPRPLRQIRLKQLTDEDFTSVRRLVTLPGAKINYRGIKNNDKHTIIEDERLYLNNWSLKNDIKTLFRTFAIIVTGKNV